MSPPRMDSDQHMARISTAEEFVKRFPQAFIEDPNLTPQIFYKILCSVEFDVKKAQLKVIELVRKPGEFIVPAALLDVPLPTPPISSPTTPKPQDESEFGLFGATSKTIPSIGFSNPSETTSSTRLGVEPASEFEATASTEESDVETDRWRLTKFSNRTRAIIKRRTPVEDSDEEILPPAHRYKRKKPSSGSYTPCSAFGQTGSETNKVAGCRTTSEADESTDEEDPPRDANRRVTHKAKSFSFGFQDEISLVEDQDTITRSSEEDSENFPEGSSYCKDSKFQRPSCSRGFSTTPDFGDESDYEVPLDNEQLRDVSPDDWEVSYTSYKKRVPRSRGVRGNLNEVVLLHRTQSLATPWMHTLARPFYPNKVDKIEKYPYARGPSTLPDLKEYLDNVRETTWATETTNSCFGSSTWKDRKLGRTGYASVSIDGVIYHPGDCVIVRGEEPSRQRKQGAGTQVDEEHVWYASIKYFFEDEFGTKMMHVRWFSHAASTPLGELACTHELFLLTACDDIELSSIARKISVSFVQRSSDEQDSYILEGDFRKNDQYFYFLHHNPDTDQLSYALDHLSKEVDDGQQSCECCDLRLAEKESTKVVPLGEPQLNGTKLKLDGICWQGEEYNLYDFVYIYDEKLHHDPTKPLLIGQIVGISMNPRDYNRKNKSFDEQQIELEVTLLERVDKFHSTWFTEVNKGNSHAVRDNRRLFFTGAITTVRTGVLSGKCFVKHRQDISDLDSYKDKPDRFWVKNKVDPSIDPRRKIQQGDLVSLDVGEIKYSERSMAEMKSLEGRVEDFLKNSKKLATLDLFSGGGGLTAAAELSQVLESRHAVEFCPAAIDHLKLNFPDCQIHNADASVLLERVCRLESGDVLEPLVINQRPIPDLPRRGDIDCICGGFPCPGYTKMNRYQQAEDIKNSLVVVFLSYIDFYRPKYVLMENVKDLLSHRLGATEVDKGKLEGGIKGGTVKLILRALTSIGYQVQYALLQAAEYEVPQSRLRVFFWAALPGYPLPNFPQPQTVYKPRFSRMKEMNWYRERKSAPHKLCTVGDALTDLPRFEWIDPYMGDDADKIRERKKRFTYIDQCEVTPEDPYVGKLKQSYATSPLSEYQRKLRKGLTNNQLRKHLTPSYLPHVTRLVCSIPLEPGADHREPGIPNDIKSAYLYNEVARKNKFYPGRYGRLDMEKVFDVCLTTIDPGSKCGRVVHPFLHRTLSLREFARAQSFPDSYKIDLEDLENCDLKDVFRIFGNAVPVNLGAAIFGELLMPLMRKYEEEKKTQQSATSVKQHLPKPGQEGSTEITSAKVSQPGRGDTSETAICIDSDDDD